MRRSPDARPAPAMKVPVAVPDSWLNASYYLPRGQGATTASSCGPADGTLRQSGRPVATPRARQAASAPRADADAWHRGQPTPSPSETLAAPEWQRGPRPSSGSRAGTGNKSAPSRTKPPRAERAGVAAGVPVDSPAREDAPGGGAVARRWNRRDARGRLGRWRTGQGASKLSLREPRSSHAGGDGTECARPRVAPAHGSCADG